MRTHNSHILLLHVILQSFLTLENTHPPESNISFWWIRGSDHEVLENMNQLKKQVIKKGCFIFPCSSSDIDIRCLERRTLFAWNTYKFKWSTSIEFDYMFIHINAILYCQLFAHLMTDLRRYDWYSQVVPPGRHYKLLKFQVNGNQNKAFCATIPCLTTRQIL